MEVLAAEDALSRFMKEESLNPPPLLDLAGEGAGAGAVGKARDATGGGADLGIAVKSRSVSSKG